MLYNSSLRKIHLLTTYKNMCVIGVEGCWTFKSGSSGPLCLTCKLITDNACSTRLYFYTAEMIYNKGSKR